MRKIYRHSRQDQNQIKKNRTNNEIKSLEVQLIDEMGTFLGKVPTAKAILMAQESGFELVEINPQANPPIAKIIDYGKFKYDLEKKQKKAKLHQKKTEIKGLRLTFRIGQHDLETKRKQAIKHLSAGDKLKIEMTLKGREQKHSELAKTSLIDFINSIKNEKPIKIDDPVKKLGAKIQTIISSTETDSTK
jgi:translation initiation factor IF-3